MKHMNHLFIPSSFRRRQLEIGVKRKESMLVKNLHNGGLEIYRKGNFFLWV